MLIHDSQLRSVPSNRTWRCIIVWIGLVVITAAIPASAQNKTGDDLDSLLDKPNKKKTGTGIKEELDREAKRVAAKAVSRVKLTESEALRDKRLREPEPGRGKLIYADNFESYKLGQTPKHWPKNTCFVDQLKTAGNKTNVMKFSPDLPHWSHAYMDPKIHATNFRLKFDFLCGAKGEVTWLGRLHGRRETSLWTNENYYQIGFYTNEGKPLSFGARHLWVGGGYPFVNAPQPGVSIPQPSYRQAWHSAEIVMDDDRFILKLNGVRVLDGHYPVLMARTRKGLEYGFGLMGRDSSTSSPKTAPFVFNDYYDNIEIYDLGTEVRQRHWPRRLHLASWGDDENSGADPAHPWKTLRKAFAELRQGDQLTLQEGTYDDDVNWVNPDAADLPRSGATRAEYPTIIRATPHENVTITGKWSLKNAGHIQVERLHFSGDKHGLIIAAEGEANGAATASKSESSEKLSPQISLRRLAFLKKADLRLNVGEGVSVECGRGQFVDGGVSMQGAGFASFARCVFQRVHTLPDESASFAHCTFYDVARPPRITLNSVVLQTELAARMVFHDPSHGRFDLKSDSKLVDAGQPLSAENRVPDWADMPIVGQPDRGAFEFYGSREVKCHMVMEKEDLLSDEPIVVPMATRTKALNDAIKSLRPGDTLSVSPGLWTESGLNLSGLKGEPYAPIRIVSEKPLAAIIHGTVRFTNCDHVYLEGFTIAGYQGKSPHKVSTGLSWQDCGRTWVVGCQITAFGHAGVSGDEQGVTLLRNWIYGNGVSTLNHGIYWAGEGPTWVVGNTFHGNAGWGFHNHQGAYDGWRGWKHNVHHNLFLGPGGAIVTTGSRGTFYNNTIIRPSHAAFWFYNDGHRDNRIANNIVVDGSNGVHTRDGNTFTHNLTFSSKAEAKNFLGESPIQADPRFVDAANNDFRLKPDSPARNVGTPVGLSDDPRPTLGAFDGNKKWMPPKPLPNYVPQSVRRLNDKLKNLDPTKALK